MDGVKKPALGPRAGVQLAKSLDSWKLLVSNVSLHKYIYMETYFRRLVLYISVVSPPTRILLVRGTPTAEVLLHWVIISGRWEQNHKHNRERPINTDSPRKKSVAVQWPNREIPGPKNTQNWHHFTRTSSSTHSNYLCLLTLLHFVLLSPFSM